MLYFFTAGANTQSNTRGNTCILLMAEMSPIMEEVLSFDGNVEGLEDDMMTILRQYGESSNEDLINMMVEETNKTVMNETRLKIFNLAKEKVKGCLSKANVGGIFGSEREPGPLEDSPLSRQFIDQWEPVGRRKPQKLASDVLDFLGFYLGHNPLFPTSLVRSTTLDKGSLEGFWKTSSTDQKTLLKDLNESNGQVLVEVVTKGADSETHLVTIAGEVQDGSVHLDIPIESLSEVSATKGGDKAEADTPVEEEEGDVDVAPAPERELKPRKLVNMATQTDMTGDRFRSVSRLEFEYHADFIERLCKETQDKVKKIEEWQSGIEKRVAAVEYNDCTLSTQADIGPKTPAITVKEKPKAALSTVTSASGGCTAVTQRNRPQHSNSAGSAAKENLDVRVLRSMGSATSGQNAIALEPARPMTRHMVNRPPPEVKSSQDESDGRDYNPYSPLDVDSDPTQNRSRGRGRGLPRRDNRPGGGARPKDNVGGQRGNATPVAGPVHAKAADRTSAVTSDSPLTVSESDVSTAYDSWYEECDDELTQPNKKRVTGINVGGMEWTEGVLEHPPVSSTPRPVQNKPQPSAGGGGETTGGAATTNWSERPG